MSPIEIVLAAALSKHAAWYNTKLFAIAEAFGSLESLFELWRLTEHQTIPATLLTVINTAWQGNNLKKIQDDLTKYEIRAMLHTDADYPAILQNLSDKPYVLYGKGDITVLKRLTCLSCVGTRAISNYGKRVIHAFLPPLARESLCIVSGLALGVDAEVHVTALSSNIATVAVLGGGLDRFEPTTNARLAEKIVQTSCVLSEYPPGVRPQKHHFLERNRIIAGLSRATLIIEGKQKSGSLVTARYALSYGRDVGVVPGDIFLANSEAPLRLLSEGAWPITSADDILTMLGIESDQKVEKKPEDNPILLILRDGLASLDDLSQKLNLPLSELQTQLTYLELEDKVASTSGGEYYIR